MTLPWIGIIQFGVKTRLCLVVSAKQPDCPEFKIILNNSGIPNGIRNSIEFQGIVEFRIREFLLD
jgi:hypothetical protein